MSSLSLKGCVRMCPPRAWRGAQTPYIWGLGSGLFPEFQWGWEVPAGQGAAGAGASYPGLRGAWGRARGGGSDTSQSCW